MIFILDFWVMLTPYSWCSGKTSGWALVPVFKPGLAKCFIICFIIYMAPKNSLNVCQTKPFVFIDIYNPNTVLCSDGINILTTEIREPLAQM